LLFSLFVDEKQDIAVQAALFSYFISKKFPVNGKITVIFYFIYEIDKFYPDIDCISA